MSNELKFMFDSSEFKPASYLKFSKNTVLNLTLHNMTTGQIEDGGFEMGDPQDLLMLRGNPKQGIVGVLELHHAPSRKELEARLAILKNMADKYNAKKILLTWVPYSSSIAEEYFGKFNIEVIYSFSLRVAVEKPMPDGSVKLDYIFKHLGYFRP